MRKPAQLICGFVFAFAKIRFSQNEAQMTTWMPGEPVLLLEMSPCATEIPTLAINHDIFSSKNYHYYNHEILQYIARTCLRNVIFVFISILGVHHVRFSQNEAQMTTWMPGEPVLLLEMSPCATEIPTLAINHENRIYNQILSFWC